MPETGSIIEAFQTLMRAKRGEVMCTVTTAKVSSVPCCLASRGFSERVAVLRCAASALAAGGVRRNGRGLRVS